MAVLERKKRRRNYSKLDPFAATPVTGIVTLTSALFVTIPFFSNLVDRPHFRRENRESQTADN
jgi:hypothetical protein